MINISIPIASLWLLMSIPLAASEISTDDEILLLQQEIKRQEVVLVALKERLQSIEKTEVNTLHFAVTLDGVEFEGEEIAAEDIQGKLKMFSQKDRVVITVDPNIPHHRMVRFMNEFHAAGFKNVALKTEKSEMPLDRTSYLRPVRTTLSGEK
ncbi:MAG: biopolymer transporter ExbD [Kiritimatiellia bacterium]